MVCHLNGPEQSQDSGRPRYLSCNSDMQLKKSASVSVAHVEALAAVATEAVAAVTAGFTLPYAGFPCTATVAQSLRPFPEYSVSLAPQFANQGNSFYDSLQVKFTKRLSHGLDMTSNYTFSKTENIGGYINADPSNRVIQKALDSNDFPHILVTAFTYRTPRFTTNSADAAIQNAVQDGGCLLGVARQSVHHTVHRAVAGAGQPPEQGGRPLDHRPGEVDGEQHGHEGDGRGGHGPLEHRHLDHQSADPIGSQGRHQQSDVASQ